MCIALTKKGVACKKNNAAGYEFCSIHIPKCSSSTENLTIYIKELEEDKEKAQISLSGRDKEILRLITQIREYKDENKKLLSRVTNMVDYYENYKKILEFERYKLSLNFEKISKKELERYNSLRQMRNKLCHPYEV